MRRPLCRSSSWFSGGAGAPADRSPFAVPFNSDALFPHLFRPAGVKWEIDWNGKDDVRLYTESVLGPVVMHSDIDHTIQRKAGNIEFPGLLAVIGNHTVNRTLWKRVGCHPVKFERRPVCAIRNIPPMQV